jgi:predicted amidophosphoribosyltransferase
MEVQLKQITGNWNRGWALHKHTLSSVYIGDNEFGRAQFDTKRSEVGEAVFQLKYRSDWSQAALLAAQIKSSIVPFLGKVGLIIPMCASTPRARQPVTEVAKALGELIDVPVFEDILTRLPPSEGDVPLKNINNKADKVSALKGKLSFKDSITNQGCWNALLLDDLFDTGASMEAACAALRTYPKINEIYAVALTWK